MRPPEWLAIITWMYRPRIEVPGGFYHVGSRGNDRCAIFLDDEDRRSYLRLLERTARRYGWLIHSYCLMTNHYHLVLQLGSGGLSRGMCQLNGGYALMFNTRRGRSNHLFGRRFWDEPIKTESHYFEACRYVVLNPIRGRTRTSSRHVAVEQLSADHRGRFRSEVSCTRRAAGAFRLDAGGRTRCLHRLRRGGTRPAAAAG